MWEASKLLLVLALFLRTFWVLGRANYYYVRAGLSTRPGVSRFRTFNVLNQLSDTELFTLAGEEYCRQHVRSAFAAVGWGIVTAIIGIATGVLD